MKHMTVNTARDNFDGIIKEVIELGEPVSVATDDGAAIIVSQEEWSGLHETLFLSSIPGMVDSIKAASVEPLSECVPASEVWSDV